MYKRQCEGKTFDEEEVALTLINHPNVLEKQATDYIVFYQSKFSVLARIGEKNTVAGIVVE